MLTDRVGVVCTRILRSTRSLECGDSPSKSGSDLGLVGRVRESLKDQERALSTVESSKLHVVVALSRHGRWYCREGEGIGGNRKESHDR
jgi:hypothetical protein